MKCSGGTFSLEETLMELDQVWLEEVQIHVINTDCLF